MFTPSWIILFSITILSYFGVIFFAYFLGKKKEEFEFTFSSAFPCEVTLFAGKSRVFYSFFVYLFAGMSFSPILIIVQGTGRLANLDPLAIFISCVLGFSGLCFIFLNIFPVTKTKPHLTIFGFFAAFCFLSTALIFARGFAVFKALSYYGIIDPISLFSQYLSVLNGTYILFIIFNRKLRTWPSLELVNGKYVRPKKFPLAYSEWRLFLALFVNIILMYVQLLAK